MQQAVGREARGFGIAGQRRADDAEAEASECAFGFDQMLVATRGGLSSKPYYLTIGLLKDREPRLTIRASGVGRRVTPVARIPLAVRATGGAEGGSIRSM